MFKKVGTVMDASGAKAIIIPQEIVKVLDIQVGDEIHKTYDHANHRLIIQFAGYESFTKKTNDLSPEQFKLEVDKWKHEHSNL